MIYLTGDTHGVEARLRELPDRILDPDAVLLVAGDFGYIWQGEDRSPREKAFLDELSRLPCTICFIDGNHEGFDALEQYPVVDHFGSPAGQIRSNLFWLQRGRIYQIQGRRIFTMGGAHSMDKPFRLALEQNGGEKAWFPQELPGAEEYRRAIASLDRADRRVDVVLTHTAPFSAIPRILGKYPDETDRELTGFLDWIYHDVDFKKWYCGHFHVDQPVNRRLQVCFERFYCVDEDLKKLPTGSLEDF